MILLPLAAFIAPINADINGPVMWVNPKETKLWAPCLVSSTFDVEVKLWNKMDLTQDAVYAFDFTLRWLNSTEGFVCGSQTKSFITFMSVEFVSPWDHFFVIADKLTEDIEVAGLGYDEYHLAITALDGSGPLEDVQIVLATLTFHIDCEPLYPDTYSTPFNLEATLAGEVDPDLGKPVEIPLHEIDDGTFTIDAKRPDVYLLPAEICEYKVGVSHTIEFWLSHISKMYGFGFEITWDNKLLEADIQSVQFCDAFPPPYESLYMEVVDNNDGTSSLIVHMSRPCEKPTVTHQPGPAVTFTLTSIYDYPDMIPLCDNSTIGLVSAYTLHKCSCAGTTGFRQYDFPGALIVPTGKTAVIDYYWRPRIGDLNLDGEVNLQDLQALAAEYGNAHDWGNLGNGGGVVDIYDFVVVAKYFGKPYECVLDPDLAPCWQDP
jgi:hypothetical protein